MSYLFQGFFAVAPEDDRASEILDSAKVRWPTALTKRLSDPLVDVAIAWVSDSLGGRVEEDVRDAELETWTRTFPSETFVRIYADCFGGVCDFGGSVWRDGTLLAHEEQYTDNTSTAPLIRLLAHLGIASENGHFEPFTRGYFRSQQ